MIVLCGPGSWELGEEMAELMGLEASRVEHRLFPDGESYLRIPVDVRGRRVILIQSTAPPQDTRLIQLLLLSEALGNRGHPRSSSLHHISLTPAKTGVASTARP